ncbi:hypothetical protein G5C60_36545 [Streptomyces sp. HC44]|uniref:Gram-positive cocci surface proteins LPxTG domain-containing protein n=1 Tax=Streptomyces scabichelini TaxID=2711217 RepID=A0A6G4VGN0_9ACTN|nr:hypothetical protein [Streptomyces scabichelini]
MRLCKCRYAALPRAVSLAVVTAAALTPVPAQALAGAAVDRKPSCTAGGGSREFPVRTRIHGGPSVYEAGGGYRTWYLDLTNTTDSVCANIHPVVVLVDEKRALKAGQSRLEFYEGDGSGKGESGTERRHPVRFERTGEDENIGVFDGDDEGGDGGFPGFTVAPGATLSVKVRLAVASDAVPNDVVANAAVVQRHDDDGDWVGQSNDYRFRIVDAGPPQELPGEVTPGEVTPEGERTPEAVPEKGLSFADELAGTGPASRRALLEAAAGAFLLVGVGAGIVVVARGRR